MSQYREYPFTLAEAQEKKYGPDFSPRKYVRGMCAAQVWPKERGMPQHQCERYGKYGPGGLYCKQHAVSAYKEYVKCGGEHG